MADFLSELDKIFNEVKDQDGGFVPLPDGEYLAEVQEVTYGESKKGLPMVTFVFRITHGSELGKTHRKFMTLSGSDEAQTRQRIHRYSMEIKRYGVDTSKGLTSTIEQFPKLVGKSVKLKLKTSKATTPGGTDYLNTNVEVLG